MHRVFGRAARRLLPHEVELLGDAARLFITVFWGGIPATASLLLWAALAYVLVLVLFVLIRNTNPRVRIDQAVKFFWFMLTPVAAVGVVLAAFGILALRRADAWVSHAGGLKKSPWVFHVNTGACNNCDIEVVDLLTPRFDVERFGIQLVGSPRHADAIVVTGMCTRQAGPRLQEIYRQTPKPCMVFVIGSCACSRGHLP